jgi:hypothetical protein
MRAAFHDDYQFIVRQRIFGYLAATAMGAVGDPSAGRGRFASEQCRPALAALCFETARASSA